MKNKTGTLGGFVAGFIGFLLLFKIIILDRTSPEDELAPGIVIPPYWLEQLLPF